MLKTLIELFVKFFQPRSAKEKAEDAVKQKLVFLHEALVECHAAYLLYSSDRSEMNLANWRKKAHDLVHFLDEIGLALATFGQQTFDYTAKYIYPEGIAAHEYSATEDEALEVRRILNRLSLLQSDEPQASDDDDFKEATSRLRQFMKENMTKGEMKKAQDAFRKDTYWKQSL